MGKLADFLSGTRILEEVDSPINGKITVIKSLAFGTHIQVNGLTQSGGILKGVWKSTLKKVKGKRLKVKECLVLGLGAGTIIPLIKKYWPDCQITGVDIDKNMIDLGVKYLGFDKKQVEIIISDAYDFVAKSSRLRQGFGGQVKLKAKRYDLICIDLYVGDEYPEKFETENYIQLVRSVLADGGIAVFNRLYFGEKRPQATRFGDLLDKNFKKVVRHFPEANLMFICSK